MVSKRMVVFLVWMVSVPVSVARAQDPAAGADVVSLRFNWPANIGIGVSFASRQVREQPGVSTDISIQGHYQISVVDHPQGLRVMQSGLETTLFESIPTMPPPVETLYRNLAALSPDYVVSADGALIGVDGLDQLAASVRDSMAPLFEAAGPQAAGVRGMVDEMLSEDALFAQIQEEWNAMVGTWVGADFELGVGYVLEESVPIPMFPDMSLPMRYSFEASERGPCAAGAAENSCVRLRMESAPDEAQLAAFVERFVARVGGELADAEGAIGQLSRVDTIELLAEPGTLLPHELTVTMEIGAAISGLAPGGSPFRRYRETRYRFGY